MREKVAKLRLRLINTLRSQFEQEIDRSLQRINEAISPYTRFVRAEENNLAENQTALEALKSELLRLRRVVEEI